MITVVYYKNCHEFRKPKLEYGKNYWGSMYCSFFQLRKPSVALTILSDESLVKNCSASQFLANQSVSVSLVARFADCREALKI